MEEVLASLAAKFTPGAVGIWSLVIMALIWWWRGLPAVMDAFANRQSKIEERMQLLLDRSTERFQRELAAADERHDQCIEGQKRLMVRVEELERGREEDRRIIAEQARTIDGMNRRFAQMQVSAIRVEGQKASPIVQAAMDSLDHINPSE